jgi:soluble lytic murein transglycosylase-like protein
MLVECPDCPEHILLPEPSLQKKHSTIKAFRELSAQHGSSLISWKQPSSSEISVRSLAISALTYANAYAHHYHVPPELVKAIIRQESNWKQRAISNKNARGLMQLTPGTAARFGVQNPFDMSQNGGGGVRYLRDLLEQYHGDMRLAIARITQGNTASTLSHYSNADVIRYVQDVRRRYLQELSAKQSSKESQR